MTLTEKIEKFINDHPSDEYDVSDILKKVPDTVRNTTRGVLGKLAKAGKIRRVGNGLYKSNKRTADEVNKPVFRDPVSTGRQ